MDTAVDITAATMAVTVRVTTAATAIIDPATAADRAAAGTDPAALVVATLAVDLASALVARPCRAAQHSVAAAAPLAAAVAAGAIHSVGSAANISEKKQKRPEQQLRTLYS